MVDEGKIAFNPAVELSYLPQERHRDLLAAIQLYDCTPSLAQAVGNCEKRAIGSNGGFGYKALKEAIEISLLDAVAIAHWLCREAKEVRPQRVSY